MQVFGEGRETWVFENEVRLAELWLGGLSASKIAAELRTTKNAIISKAVRLGLPGRLSPIKRDETAGARCARIYGPPSGHYVRNAERPAAVDGALVEGLWRAGYSWSEIAAEFGVSREAVIEAARWRGLTEAGQRRYALPPGHPRTWNMLNEGLVSMIGVRYDARLA